MDYKQFEDSLFAEWRQRSIDNGDGEELAPDGLLYRFLGSRAGRRRANMGTRGKARAHIDKGLERRRGLGHTGGNGPQELFG